MNRYRALRLDGERGHLGRVVQKKARIQIHRQDVTGNADGDGPAISGKRLLDIADLIR